MHKMASSLAGLVALVTIAACGNAVGEVGPPSGLAGISVTDDGEHIVNLFVCNGKIDTISIVKDRQGLKETQANPPVQTYRTDKPLAGLVTLNLSRPGQEWSPSSPTELEPAKGYIVAGVGSAKDDSETSPLNIRTSSLSQLVPGSVYVTDDLLTSKLTRLSPAQFEARAEKACG